MISKNETIPNIVREKINKFTISGEVLADLPNPALYQLNGRMKLSLKTSLTRNDTNPEGTFFVRTPVFVVLLLE